MSGGPGSPGAMPAPLGRLASRVEKEGPPLVAASALPETGPDFAGLVASGPRTARDPEAYAFVVEAVREGYLCHYEASRVLERPDGDLALLAGDLFYAIGISALAELDDVVSVKILSDLIRVSAELRSAGLRREAESMWVAAILALACGPDAEYERLGEDLAAGNAAARQALDDWSLRRAKSNGAGRILAEVREAIHLRTDT